MIETINYAVLEQLRCNFHLGLIERAQYFNNFMSTLGAMIEEDDGIKSIMESSGRGSIAEYVGCAYNMGIITYDETEMLLDSYPNVNGFVPVNAVSFESLGGRLLNQMNGVEVEPCKPINNILDLLDQSTGDELDKALSVSSLDLSLPDSGSNSSNSVKQPPVVGFLPTSSFV